VPRPDLDASSCRTRAGGWDDPDGWSPLISVRRGRGEGAGLLGHAGEERGGGWLGPCRPAGPGCVGGRKGKEASRAGPCGKKKKEKRKKMGWAKREKEGEKEMHLDLFEFEFEI
jgi:hypothetical protein